MLEGKSGDSGICIADYAIRKQAICDDACYMWILYTIDSFLDKNYKNVNRSLMLMYVWCYNEQHHSHLAMINWKTLMNKSHEWLLKGRVMSAWLFLNIWEQSMNVWSS